MKQQTFSAVPRWYWVIAAVALLWNLMGCAFFAMELFAQEAFMESMTEPMKEWARSIPGWIYFVYGLAVLTGLVGSIGLFLRKSWTTLMFAICLVAVIVQMVYTMIIGGGLTGCRTIGTRHARADHWHSSGATVVLAVRP